MIKTRINPKWTINQCAVGNSLIYISTCPWNVYKSWIYVYEIRNNKIVYMDRFQPRDSKWNYDKYCNECICVQGGTDNLLIQQFADPDNTPCGRYLSVYNQTDLMYHIRDTCVNHEYNCTHCSKYYTDCDVMEYNKPQFITSDRRGYIYERRYSAIRIYDEKYRPISWTDSEINADHMLCICHTYLTCADVDVYMARDRNISIYSGRRYVGRFPHDGPEIREMCTKNNMLVLNQSDYTRIYDVRVQKLVKQIPCDEKRFHRCVGLVDDKLLICEQTKMTLVEI
jgi:hypothetical protein